MHSLRSPASLTSSPALIEEGMGEIITLQFGNFANYVGTHYWNIQVCGNSFPPFLPYPPLFPFSHPAVQEKNYDYCEANGIEHEIQSSLLWRSDETSNVCSTYPLSRIREKRRRRREEDNIFIHSSNIT